MNLGTNWVKFSAIIDPNNVILPVSDPIKNRNSEKLLLGMAYSNTENMIYPAFFTPRRSFSDTVMISTTGKMTYQVPLTSFRTAPEIDPAAPGKFGAVVTLNKFNCQMHSEGKINLSLNSGPLFMETFGSMDYYIIPGSTNFRLGMILDFPFEEQVMEKIRDQMTATNLPGIQLFNTGFNFILSELIEEDELENLKSELELVGKFRRFPDELDKTMIIADVRMSYDTIRRSFISTGSIGIATIKDEIVNRYLKGKIELTKKRNGDEFTFYLEITPNDWFFFNYRNNIMQFLSSDLDLNDKIKEAQLNRKEFKRLNKIWRGYRYTLSTGRKKRDFMRRYQLGEE